MSSRATSIHCHDIHVVFKNGKTHQSVLGGLDLQVPTGQIVSLLGPSGCGKSTLLRVVAGLIEPTSGSVLTNGLTPQAARSRMSFVFQEAALLPWRTVYQNVRLPLELNRPTPTSLTVDRVENRVESWLSTVGFAKGDWNKYPSQLSGGMKMRASIARALVTNPSILLLDEPFAALDDMLRSKLNDLLLDIAQTNERTMLFVTHSISEAIYLSHSIAVMSSGRIANTLEVPLPFPRHASIRSSVEFASFYGTVSETLVRSNS